MNITLIPCKVFIGTNCTPYCSIALCGSSNFNLFVSMLKMNIDRDQLNLNIVYCREYQTQNSRLFVFIRIYLVTCFLSFFCFVFLFCFVLFCFVFVLFCFVFYFCFLFFVLFVLFCFVFLFCFVLFCFVFVFVFCLFVCFVFVFFFSQSHIFPCE